MTGYKRTRNIAAGLLVFILVFQWPVSQFSQNEEEVKKQYEKAKEKYIEGEYFDARQRLERLLTVINDKNILKDSLYGKCSLLLGAICEKLGDLSMAEGYYREAMEKYNTSWIEDIVLTDLKVYQKIRNIVFPPAPPIHGPGGKKKSKKFPWLMVAGGIVLAGAAILFFPKKKTTTDNSNYDTKVLGIEWIDIPVGDYEMGDLLSEGSADELPVHTVNIRAYRISKYEVTFDQYDTFCQDTGREKPDDLGWGRSTRPVINVSWEDAKAFCEWLSQKTGKNIHLPTEAQWEKAARGYDQRRFPWGNATPTCLTTNYNRCNAGTMPVGSFSSDISPYGVYDMGGNVHEWCEDLYDAAYYSTSPRDNPTGASAGDKRVYRGGSRTGDDSYSRVSDRNAGVPTITRRDLGDLGFRIAAN